MIVMLQEQYVIKVYAKHQVWQSYAPIVFIEFHDTVDTSPSMGKDSKCCYIYPLSDMPLFVC